MPDERYRNQGYSAELLETEYGAFLTVKQHGRRIGTISVGFFTGDSSTPLQVRTIMLTEDEDVHADHINVFHLGKQPH